MNGFQLASTILRDTWLIDPRAAQPYWPLVASLMEGRDISSYTADLPDSSFSTVGRRQNGKRKRYQSLEEAPRHSIFILSVNGPLTKHGGLCSYGMADMQEWLEQADAHPNIDSHVLVMDTPGGTVNGTEDFANAVARTKKPVVAYINNMAASAGYWIGSSADRVMVSGHTAEAGSIGTMISLANFRKMYEERGIEFHDVRATASKDKNEAFYKMLEGSYKEIRAEILDPLNDAFLKAVKNNRGGQLNPDTLTGKVYVGEAIIKMGLADSMGSLDDALDLADQLVSQHQNNKQMSFLKNFFASARKKAEESGEDLNEEQLNEQAEAEIDRLARENEELRQQMAASQQQAEAEAAQAQEQATATAEQRRTIEERLSALEARNRELEQENARLGEQAAEPVRTTATADRQPDAEKEQIPLLDVEEEAIAAGAKIDHSFERERGKFTFV